MNMNAIMGAVLFVIFAYAFLKFMNGSSDAFKKEYEELLANEEYKVKGRFE